MYLTIGIYTSVILLASISLATGAQSADSGGMQSSVAIDLHGEFGLNPTKKNDRIEPREVEFSFYAPVDHLVDGNLSFAAHQEKGEYLVELHEAILSSSRIIPRSRFRAGQFFLGVGRLNQTHRHDWPFTSPPAYHKEFFAEEGALDSGLEVSTLLPLPIFLELRAGATNGWKYGHSHNEGEKPLVPTHYGRLTFFVPWKQGGLQFAPNYLHRQTADRTNYTLVGLDLVAKKREKTAEVFLIQSEAWIRTVRPEVGDQEKKVGSYLFIETSLFNHHLFGVRYDYSTSLSLRDAGGDKVKNGQNALVPTYTYRPSEFSSLRLGYNYGKTVLNTESPEFDKFVEIQATLILGAHPAHDF